MTHFRPALLALVLCTLTSSGAFAQLNTWERTHPDGPGNSLGGSVSQLTLGADGTTYMTSGFGRYFSRTNAAAIWELYTPTLNGTAFSPFGYFPHPTIPGQIIAQSSGDWSVIRSQDFGRTWTLLSSQTFIRIMTRSPVDSAIFYARGLNSDNDKLFHSVDGGVTWSATLMANMDSMGDLEMDSVNPGVLYALDGQRIKKTVDGGSTWQVAEQGTGNIWWMSDLAINPSNPQKLYAASGASAYMFSTDDAAANWDFINLPNFPGTGAPMSAVKIDPSNHDRVFSVGGRASIYASVNGGQSWLQYADPLGINDWYHVAFSGNGSVVVAGVSGVAEPQANGTVEYINEGFSDFKMKKIVRTPNDPRFMYAGGENGVAVYDVINDQWTTLSRPFDHSIRGISVNPQNSEHVYVASIFGGVHESTNAGQTWQEVPLPDGANFGEDIEVAPSDPTVLYFRSEDGLYRSSDSGATWELVLAPDVFNTGGVRFPIEISPLNPDIVTVGTWNFGLFTTFDGGQSWKSTTGMFPDESVISIATDPRNPETIYAALADGYLLQSVDSGDTWVEFDTSAIPGQFRTVAVDTIVPGRIFLFAGNRLYAFEPTQQQWVSLGPSGGIFCELDACQVLPDSERQGYITLQASGQLFSIQRDSDSDQLGDDVDNCTLVQNADQRDTDADGYGNICDPDFNNDLVVNFIDVAYFAGVYLTTDPAADLDGDGVVNFIDLALLRDFFLKPPGPGVNGQPGM